MASNYWIKLYHEMLDDPKIGRLTDSQYRLMINLFLLAGDYEQDGYLPEIGDIRWRLREPENLDANIEALKQYEIIEVVEDTILIRKFAERQAAMSAEERSRRRHERTQKQEYYNPETRTISARNAHESGIDIDIDIDRDIDIDIDNKSSSAIDLSLVSPLLECFTKISFLKSPPEKAADFKGNWFQPIHELIEMAENDFHTAESILTNSMKVADGNFRVSSPRSLLKTFKSEHAQMKRNKQKDVSKEFRAEEFLRK